jgi:hypothetical protein
VYVHEGALLPGGGGSGGEAGGGGGELAWTLLSRIPVRGWGAAAAGEGSKGCGGSGLLVCSSGRRVLPPLLPPNPHLLAPGQASESGPCTCLAWRPFTAGVPPLLLAGGGGGAKAWCHQQAAWRVRGRGGGAAGSP